MVPTQAQMAALDRLYRPVRRAVIMPMVGSREALQALCDKAEGPFSCLYADVVDLFGKRTKRITRQEWRRAGFDRRWVLDSETAH